MVAAQGQAGGLRLPAQLRRGRIKDVGIIGVDSGWEMYIGGNGGIKTEVAEFFVKLKTAEEVREYNGAFLQLYREEAFYLERTVHYLQRVGMEHIRKAVVEDAENRKALNDRLQFAPLLRAGPMEAAHRTAAIEEGVRTDSAQATGKRLNPLSGPSHGGPPLPE